jgi:hypothetical protein
MHLYLLCFMVVNLPTLACSSYSTTAIFGGRFLFVLLLRHVHPFKARYTWRVVTVEGYRCV